MQGSSSILDEYVVSSLEVCHHPLGQSHVKVSLNRIIDVSLVEVRVCEHKLNLKLVYQVINLLFRSALPWGDSIIAPFDLDFDHCMSLIKLISSDHVGLVLRACKRVNLNPVNQLIRNIRLVVVTLLAGTHINLSDRLSLFIIVI